MPEFMQSFVWHPARRIFYTETKPEPGPLYGRVVTPHPDYMPIEPWKDLLITKGAVTIARTIETGSVLNFPTGWRFGLEDSIPREPVWIIDMQKRADGALINWLKPTLMQYIGPDQFEAPYGESSIVNVEFKVLS